MAIGISYKDHTEAANLAGKSVAEARRQYQALFGIPDRAKAVLNGRPVTTEHESEVRLHDCDELTFVVRTRSKMPILVGALLLTMAITGGIFAFTFTTASSTVSVTAAGSDFAAVSENVASPLTWTARGFFKGTIGAGNLFDIDTLASNYTGDLTATVTLANADALVEAYRVMVLKIQVYDGTGAQVDINGSDSVTGADFALLTLNNAETNLFIQGQATEFVVKVVSGFYVSNVWGSGWTSTYEDPQLFAEVAQR